MQVSQERQRSRDQRRSRPQRIEHALQNHIYRLAERRAGSWRRVILGYLFVLPILALTVLLTLGLQHVVNDFDLEDGTIVLAFSLVALLWGWGPALLLLLLGIITLDTFFITPYEWNLITWPNILQLLPFVLAGLAIGILSLQRDKGWVQTRISAQELAQARQRLEDEALLKERFLSMTSHELKTPVTSILMQSQLLERRLKKRQPVETAAILQALGTINERSHFLASMIEELLDISRVQPHRETLVRKMHDMNVLCQQVVEDQRIVSGRSILFQGSPTSATIYGDYSRLTQVVSNIVNNAIKYSPASSPIEVSVQQDAQHVIVQVHDYGPGVSQDHLDHIFEPFYRAPTAQASTVGGLGLGLAISKQIVELHEGRIWCTSTPGSGCTFFVALPANE